MRCTWITSCPPSGSIVSLCQCDQSSASHRLTILPILNGGPQTNQFLLLRKYWKLRLHCYVFKQNPLKISSVWKKMYKINFHWICVNIAVSVFGSKNANDRMTVAGVHHSALTDSSLPCSPIILLPANDGSNLWIDHPFSFVFQHKNICAVFGSLVFQEAPAYLSRF